MDVESWISAALANDQDEKKTLRLLPIARFFLGLVAIVLLSLCIQLIVFNTGPNIRGFFCDDNSIRYPYRASVVSFSELVIFCLLLNSALIFFVEIYHAICDTKKQYSKYEKHGSKMFTFILRCFIFFSYFLAFQLFILNIVTVAKYSVGRLRPNFIDVCRPVVYLSDGSSKSVLDGCNGLEGRYLTNYTCTGTNLKHLAKMRLSFFSGHASFALGTATFATFYLQFRLKLKSKLFVRVLQVILFAASLFISYTRVYDNQHHWTDVFTGIIVGFFTMALLCRYTAKFVVEDLPTNVEPNNVSLADKKNE